MQQYNVIGIMSGTSLDGVDLAHCVFTHHDGSWQYEITHAETIPYEKKWITRLTHLHTQPAFVYPKTDAFYGKYLGKLAAQFIAKHHLTPHFISSHGHTIFHQPGSGFTAQIGSGAAIYAETGLPTVCDFRTVDVALGGQGAPLVPVGDELLFPQYDGCLNLGGFSNISFREKGQRVAFDTGPCNIVMNPLAEALGLPYDDNGNLAREGVVNNDLLQQLNGLDFYRHSRAKSLGIEWVRQEFWPVVKPFELPVADLLATVNRHAAEQVAHVIVQHRLQNVLVTGGGAFNQTLVQHIGDLSGSTLRLPSSLIIQYKEALIFAFLGVLRVRSENNSLKSVTGSRRDAVNGCIYGPLAAL